MMCNRDCFNCPYDDCVVDDVTDEELEMSSKRDLEIVEVNAIQKPKSNRGRKRTKTEAEKIQRRREYYRENREEKRAIQRMHYYKQRELLKDGEKKCSRCMKVVGDKYNFSLCPLCLEKKRLYQRRIRASKKEVV